MDNITTTIVETLAQGKDLKELFRSEVEKALNMLLETERTGFLGYEPYAAKGRNSGNSRNGFYKSSLTTDIGVLNLRIPRDRLGVFNPQTTTSYMDSQDTLEQSIILLYRKGITTREITDLIEKMYGHHYSPQTISNMSQIVEEEIVSFKQREVKKRYTSIFCDATFINVRRDTVAKEALHVIIGIDEQGHKEVLSFDLYPTEAASNYKEMLEDLKTRGLEEVLLFVSDELTGLSTTLTDSFPKAYHQSCWTHLLRNTSNKVRPKDKDEVLADLKPVYTAINRQVAEEKLVEFIDKWVKKYPKVTGSYQAKNNIFSFLEFPETIRASLYTNNITENFNKQLKRRIKTKEQFPNPTALEKAVYCYVSEYNTKLGQRIHKGFKAAQYQINKLFEETYPKPTRKENPNKNNQSLTRDQEPLELAS